MRFPDRDTAPRARAAAVALLLFAVYWLTASGAFHSIDEQAVFAVSRNLVLHGKLNESALFWAQPYTYHARVGLDGELYSKYGIGHSLLVALPVALARFLPGAGLSSSAMVLNALATALTAGLLVLVAGRLGYTEWTGVLLALLYGLCTYAWVYAKTMFSEPLVALCWVLAVWILLRGQDRRHALVAGMALAVAVMVRPASLLMTPFFALPLWRGEGRGRWGWLALPVACAVVGLLAFNQVRFGNPLEFGYVERFGAPIMAGVSGFLLSLDRSLFLFAPPLLLLPWGLPPFMRRHGRWGWTFLGVAAASILAYSLWPVFWGGPVWGPRYLLPAVPLLMLCLGQVVETARQGWNWQRYILLLLALVGLAMGVRGVVWNTLPLTQTLGPRFPLWLLPPRGEWLDLAWLAGPGAPLLTVEGLALPAVEGTAAAAIAAVPIHTVYFPAWLVGLGAVLVSGLLILLAAAALVEPGRASLGAAIAGTVVGSFVLVIALGQISLGYPSKASYWNVVARLLADGRAGDALVLNPAPYQSPFDELAWFMNRADLRTPVYGLYREPPEAPDETPGRLKHLLQGPYGASAHGQGYDRLWLLTEGVLAGDPTSTTERLLADEAMVTRSEWLTEGFRLVGFEAPRAPDLSGEPGVSLGGIASLERWELAWKPEEPASAQVTLTWEPLKPAGGGLHTFIQAMDGQGQLLADWDGVPHAGFAPSEGWVPGEPVTDRVALELPRGTPAGAVRILVGLYDPATGERLRTPAGADAVEVAALTLPELVK